MRVALGQGEETWIPVEATPQGGAVGSTLGRIPWAGSGDYEDAYQSPQRLLDLGPNMAPTAGLRLPVAQVAVDEAATLLALTSRDADGEIVVYWWAIDGSKPTLTKTPSLEYTFRSGGVHTVTLTVVDNRGARATTTESVRVRSGEGEAVGAPPSGGCGCGGG